MIRFVLTVPDRMKPDVLEQMLHWRTEDETITIRIISRPSIAASVASPEPQSQADPEDAELAIEPDWMGPAAGEIQPAPAPARTQHRSHNTLYRVIDTATHMGPVPQIVRLYLLDHPNSTARDVQAGTGRGMKSIESAIYALRHKGIVRESQSN